MRIVTILGARPQFVKASVLSRALTAYPQIEEYLIHTGQHFDGQMSAVFFQELHLPEPQCHLGIDSLPHGAMTGRMLEAIEKQLFTIKPDGVLVYGDTNSTLAGALAAVKLQIPVAHVEAGLRAFDMQIPEEVNRVITDHVSQILFTPTGVADKNLEREGIPRERRYQTGDVMYDATIYYEKIAREQSNILSRNNLNSGEYLLATIHRPVNTDSEDSLRQVCAILELLGTHHRVIWPVHPRTFKRLREFHIQVKNVTLTEPVGFLDMINLEKHAALIMTDSGGVQKEAYFHKVPCVTLKAGTEWNELVEHGWNTILPPEGDPREIAEKIRSRIGQRGEDVALYGAGDAARQIAEILAHQWQ